MISYQLRGMKELRAALRNSQGVLANEMALALRLATRLVADITASQTPVGPGHFGFHARDTLRTDVTGGLVRQVGRVMSDAPQLRWREFGTKPHEIGGRTGSPLAFQEGRTNVVVVAVHHPGEKARHTMRKALTAAKPQIKAFFKQATDRLTKSLATRPS